MRKYTKKDREQAILICAIAASTPAFDGYFYRVTDAMGLGYWSAACDFACHAYHAPGVREIRDESERCAASEQIIRCGWSPGDPVEEL